MPDVLVAATILSLLFAVLMTVIAAKLLRDSRTRTSSRVEALQALAAEPPAHEPAAIAAPAPAPFVAPRAVAPPPQIDGIEASWDLALREEPTLPVGAMLPRSRPVADLSPARASTSLRHAAIEPRTSNYELRTSNFEPRTSNYELQTSSISDHDLFESAVEPAPSRRWTGMAAAALVMILGAGTFYLVSSGIITRAMARHDANDEMTNARPIELLSLRYASESGNFVVTGLVQNPAASVSLHSVFAIVYLFDADGKFMSSARASLESGVLSPGGESGFVVRVPATGDVTKYRVSFQHEDGAAVQHVDKRGALPANTTGDAVDAAANRASLSTSVARK